MKRGALLAVLGSVAVACGARTGLLLGGTGGAGSGSGGGVGLATACQAALQPGAPTPMPGYCPTQTNQAALAGPRSPQQAWTAQPFPVAKPQDFLPAQVLVDAQGNAYVAINGSPLGQLGPSPTNVLFAIGPDGSTLWQQTPAGAVTLQSLDSKGTLWVTGPMGYASQPNEWDGGPEGVAQGLSPATGAPVETLTSPVYEAPPYGPLLLGYNALALGADGSFFLALAAATGNVNDAVAHISPASQLLWRWPTDYAFQSGGGLTTNDVDTPLLVTPDERVVLLSGQSVMGLAADGSETWSQGLSASRGAIDASGNAVLLVSDDDGLSLQTFDPAGNSVRTVSLGSPPVTQDATQLALAGDGTTLVLLANEVPAPSQTKTHVEVLAIDASGATRWTATLDETLAYDPAAASAHYGMFVDGAGTVVVTAGQITGLDLASGSVLWTLAPPNPEQCVRPAVLGAGGSILATQCDGTVFLARDP